MQESTTCPLPGFRHSRVVISAYVCTLYYSSGPFFIRERSAANQPASKRLAATYQPTGTTDGEIERREFASSISDLPSRGQSKLLRFDLQPESLFLYLSECGRLVAPVYRVSLRFLVSFARVAAHTSSSAPRKRGLVFLVYNSSQPPVPPNLLAVQARLKYPLANQNTFFQLAIAGAKPGCVILSRMGR
jgi:hypothetical protein